MHYFLNSEAPSCSDSFDLGLQYLQTQDAKEYIGLHLWALVQDFLGSDEEIELDEYAEKMATIENYIQEFVDALPAVTNVLKDSKTELCGSQWIRFWTFLIFFLYNNKIAQFCIQYAYEKTISILKYILSGRLTWS